MQIYILIIRVVNLKIKNSVKKELLTLLPNKSLPSVCGESMSPILSPINTFSRLKKKKLWYLAYQSYCFNMVPATRIELAWVASQDSKSCVSTYFTMPASLNEYSIFSYLFQYYISLCCKRFQWIILANIINLLSIFLLYNS